jgi:Tol biopolymer transport system component
MTRSTAQSRGVRRSTGIVGPAAAALLLGVLSGCGAAIDRSTAEGTQTPSASLTSPAAACGVNEPDVRSPSNAGAGVADPAGRLYFGPIVGQDEIGGQIIAPLYSMDADGSDLGQVLDCRISRPRVSRDGLHLTFGILLDDGSWQVATSASDGSDLRILTSYAKADEFEKTGTPDWSPDGTWLAFSYNHTLWRMDADGSNAERIGPADGFDAEPRVSPDGSALVFLHGDFSKGVSEPWIHDLRSGAERSLTPTNTRELEHPDWSPDGRRVVYNTLTDASGVDAEIIESVPYGKAESPPTVLAGKAGSPAFKPVYSPDGRRIAYGCGDSLCLMNADGSNQVVLFNAPGQQLNHFAWGPPTP